MILLITSKNTFKTEEYIYIYIKFILPNWDSATVPIWMTNNAGFNETKRTNMNCLFNVYEVTSWCLIAIWENDY